MMKDQIENQTSNSSPRRRRILPDGCMREALIGHGGQPVCHDGQQVGLHKGELQLHLAQVVKDRLKSVDAINESNFKRESVRGEKKCIVT